MPRRSIKQGDLFALGRHRLLCGDATNAEHVATLLQKDKVQLIATDPPYGVGYVEGKPTLSNRHRAIQGDTMSPHDFREFSYRWLTNIAPHLARKNACYIFGADTTLFAQREAMEGASFKFGQLLIWIKQRAVPGRRDYLPQHELITYGWHGVHAFYKAKDKSVLFYPSPTVSRLHPTMKPLGLMRRLILNSSRTGDIVYDGFAGSGSTLIACEQTMRRARVIETDPAYCKVILERFEKLTRAKPQQLTTTNHATTITT